MKANKCEECGDEIHSDYDSCTQCCDHEPDSEEGFHCLICGKDCSEDVMARAYDRAKDFYKYGH